MSNRKKTLLISIKPYFFQKILDGHKEIELRKVLPRVSSGDMMLVYQSSPAKKLSAVFEIKSVFSGKPEEIWKIQGNKERRLGVSKSEFDAYFQGSKKAVCIEFKVIHIFKKPVPLSDIRHSWPNFRPPQGFYYLKNDEYDKLFKLTDLDLQNNTCDSTHIFRHSPNVEYSPQVKSKPYAEIS
jgi:predicted transcriptional regulator